MAKSYDVLIIGGGQAGIPLAYELAEKGKRVALAERKNLGGSCVNFGCTPTKAVIASARVAQLRKCQDEAYPGSRGPCSRRGRANSHVHRHHERRGSLHGN